MGLTESLSRYAVRTAHVLVVEAPGHWLTRVAVERHLLERGWRLALSPAEADVLAVCGTPGPDLAEKVERVWGQLPGPRTRVDVTGPADASDALLRAEQVLLDTAEQHDDSRSRPAVAAEIDSGDGHGEDEDEDEDEGEHAGHGDMDHGDMEMAPAGIPLAEGGEDRDGLEMDLLHVRLGPVLAYWPAGLVLRCSLQGDVVVDAEAGFVDGGPGESVQAEVRREAPSYRTAALRCDNVVSLLALAGWDDGAARARRVRDLLLFQDTPTGATEDLDALRRRVRRSWPLRWSLRRLLPLTDEDLEEHALPARLKGDTYDRLLAMLDRAAADLSRGAADGAVGGPGAGEPGADADDRWVPPDAIPQLVTGLDLATARLVVASLDLDPVAAPREVERA